MEITLEWLRKEAKEAYTLAKNMSVEAGKGRDVEMWDTARITLGEAFAYERIIQQMRGLSEREFQLAKKNGTL